MVNLPYVVSGIVYDTNGTTPIANVKVTVRNQRSSQSLSTTSDANGAYAVDLANLTNGYLDQDLISIFVLYTNFEDYEEHKVVEANGGTTINLTLVIVPTASGLRYFTVQEFFDFFHLSANEESSPNMREISTIGIAIEDEIDSLCQTRWSNDLIEIPVDTCDATTNWNASTDAIAVTVDTSHYKTKSGSLKLGKSGTSEAFFHYSKTTTSRDFTNKTFVCLLDVDSTTGLATTGTAITLKFGSDSSNYYQKTYQIGDISTGWNVLYFKSDDPDVTVVSNPDITACDYSQIYFTTAAASTTFSAGAFNLDNLFVVDTMHFNDEYVDTKNIWQKDYFVKRSPIYRLLQCLGNTASKDQAESWAELTEDADNIDVSKTTGRVTIRAINVEDVVSTNVQKGTNQVRLIYLHGYDRVPREIKRLAIMMVARDLMQSAVGRALMRGQDSFKSDHYLVLDRQIESVLARYRYHDMLNV